MELKHKANEQGSLVNRQKQTKVEDKIFWKSGFWAHSEKLKK